MFELQEQIVQYIENDEYENALEYLDIYQKQYDKDDFYYLAYSDVLFAMGLFQDVIDNMLECIDAGYEASIVYERLADAYIALYDYKEALIWLQKCDLETDSQEGLHNLYSLGHCYMQMKDYKQAVSYFEDVLLDSDSTQAKLNAAFCYWHINKRKRAIEYFDELIYQQANVMQICIFLGRQNDYDLLLHYLTYIQDPAFVPIQKIEYFIYHKQYDDAIELLNELLNEAPNVYLYVVLADTYKAIGNHYLAQLNYRKALHTDNSYEKEPEKIIGLYLYALERANYKASGNREYLKKYLKMYPQDVNVYFQVISFYFNTQDYHALNHLMTQQEHPIFYNQEDEYKFFYYQIESCFYADHFIQAYKLLKECKNQRQDKLYEKQFAIASFYTQRYTQCVRYAKKWLPDGMLATLCIYALKELGKYDQIETIRERMQEAIEANEEIEDLDVYLSTLEKEYE